jgi:hypothetical protein
VHGQKYELREQALIVDRKKTSNLIRKSLSSFWLSFEWEPPVPVFIVNRKWGFRLRQSGGNVDVKKAET